MDFRELTYITTVADCRSVTAAAKKLYISQPSLSYIISKVEADVGVKLFDRKTNPLSLTYAGKKYVETAKEILRLRDNLRRELADIGAGETGEIRIGMPTERAGYMLPRVAGKFHESFPRVQLHLMESKSGEIIDSLINDRITFAVLPGGTEGMPGGLTAEFIYREPLVVVTGDGIVTEEMLCGEDEQDGMLCRESAQDGEYGQGDRPSRESAPDGEDSQGDRPCRESAPDGRRADLLPAVDLRKMKDLPYIILRKGQFNRRQTDLILAEADVNPRVIMEVSSCMSAAQLAKSGLGYTIVPERAVLAFGGYEHFHCYRINSRHSVWDVNAFYKNGSYLDKAERYFIDLMKEVFRNP